MRQKEINRLWVSSVSRWGCLNDSDFSVFANPECICTNRKSQVKRFDLRDRERERKRLDAEQHSPGATLLLYLTCVCTHTGAFDSSPRFPPWLFVTASPQIQRALVSLRLKITQSYCTTLPVTTINTYHSRKLTAGLRLLGWERPTTERKTGEGRCICTSAATGIFNLQG